MTSPHVLQHAGHVTINPKILYFGTPVVLVSTENDDGTANLAPMSSAWALGNVVVLGLGCDAQMAYNLARRPDLVINLPAPRQWEAVERLAPLTGRDPVPTHRFEAAKFDAAGLTPQPSHRVRPPGPPSARCNWKPAPPVSNPTRPAVSSSSKPTCWPCTPARASWYPAPTTSTRPGGVR